MAAAPAALALAGCAREADGQPVTRPATARSSTLKQAAPFPVGAAVGADRLDDPAYAELLVRHFDQITPENEMKSWMILQEDGSSDFSHADKIAAFARRHGLRLFGHTLIYYQEDPAPFRRLVGDRTGFERLFRSYIGQVAGRYAGQAVGWDVVNEAVHDDGDRLRGGVFQEALGLDYIGLAFEAAREADPQAVLFLNDYKLERDATKRRTFLRLCEALLRDGVPLGGIGTQSHIDLDTDPAVIGPAMRELAGLGLPIHVSETDMGLYSARLDFRSERDRLEAQARMYGTLAEAFFALPERQRFAFSTWGVRDQDSWLRRPRTDGYHPRANPLLFDDAGAPKPAFDAVVGAWTR